MHEPPKASPSSGVCTVCEPVLVFLVLTLNETGGYSGDVIFLGAFSALLLLFLAGFKVGRAFIRVLSILIFPLWGGTLVLSPVRVGVIIFCLLWSAVLAAFGLAVVLSFGRKRAASSQ
jgi:hypothetical protein